MHVLPWKLVYVGSRIFVYPILRHLIKYRLETTNEQLALVYSKQEDVDTIRKAYYHHLSKVIVEILKGLYTNESELTSKMRYTNPEILSEAYAQGKDVIMMAGHFENWEWGIAVGQRYLQHQVVGVYKPMSNPYVNQYILDRRQKNGSKLIPTTQFIREFLTSSNRPRVFMILADQYPAGNFSSSEYPFLGINTKFQNGIDKLVQKYEVPCYYAFIHEVELGRYELSLLPLHKEANGYENVTSEYVKKLNSSISLKPEAWLWSHKRWRK